MEGGALLHLSHQVQYTLNVTDLVIFNLRNYVRSRRVFSFVKSASSNTIELSPGTCEKSLDDVTGELTNQGFEVWDTCLGDPGVTLMIV